ncbi:MAG: zf-HC2 domain-containing protein [Candidatus Marinimicrobia bacterium]|nr:zf-HC2 domain-containing protein [Candidatus Neomarinimicrobiota bacterium]
MISCYQFKTIISHYIDKDISFQGRKSFEEHMDSCPGCKQLYQSILSTKNSMLQFAEVTVSDNFLDKLRTKILAERNARIEASLNKGFSLNRIPSFTYGFAAALVAVIIGFYLFEFQTRSIPTQMPPQIVQEKIQQKTGDPKNYYNNPPLMGRGQYANSENYTDSLDHSSGQSSRPKPDFQDNIKTVKKEY